MAINASGNLAALVSATARRASPVSDPFASVDASAIAGCPVEAGLDFVAFLASAIVPR